MNREITSKVMYAGSVFAKPPHVRHKSQSGLTNLRPKFQLGPRIGNGMRGAKQTTKDLSSDVDVSSVVTSPMEERSESEIGASPSKPGSPSSILTSTALVAGTAVGAGLLALPKSTIAAGFIPSVGGLLWGFTFNVISGLLLAEVAVSVMRDTGNASVSSAAMVDRAFGKTGSLLVSSIFVVHNWLMLIAYISKGGSSLAALLPAADLDGALGAGLFVLAIASFCYLLPESRVESLNSSLVGLLVASFLGLILCAAPFVDGHNLVAQFDPEAIVPALPTVALAFVYQNVVPIVCAQQGGDPARIRQAIIYGSAIPLAMFVLWEAVVLGATPLGPGVDLSLVDPIALLAERNGSLFSTISTTFALFAVSTSFIGFVLGLSSFFRDAYSEFVADKARESESESESDQLPKEAPVGGPSPGVALSAGSTSDTGLRNPAPFLLAILPPAAVVAVGFDENMFYAALHQAGTWGVMLLFGILPPLMVLKVRDRDREAREVRAAPADQAQEEEEAQEPALVGRSLWPLMLVGVTALYVMGCGIAELTPL